MPLILINTLKGDFMYIVKTSQININSDNEFVIKLKYSSNGCTLMESTCADLSDFITICKDFVDNNLDNLEMITNAYNAYVTALTHIKAEITKFEKPYKFNFIEYKGNDTSVDLYLPSEDLDVDELIDTILSHFQTIIEYINSILQKNKEQYDKMLEENHKRVIRDNKFYWFTFIILIICVVLYFASQYNA